MNQEFKKDLIETYKLNKDQIEIYNWLGKQNLNTSDETFCYWVKTYPAKRIKEVVDFANFRRNAGQDIKNIGGWIRQFLKNGLPVVDENSKMNYEFVMKFLEQYEWKDLRIYEKYTKDNITGDDLPLNMQVKDFKTSLETLYRKSKLYK